MNKKSGKFIVFEGPDGSGKATQARLLASALKNEGYQVKEIDFPQYGHKSAGLVENYLSGNYGLAEEVGPYRASIFYACDRYDASFILKKWIEEGNIVIADRYTSSSAAHQGGKIGDSMERKKYLDWLYNLEYGIFGIPKPDITLILKTSVELSYKLSLKNEEDKKKKKVSHLGKKGRDIHEEDFNHLENAFNTYLYLAREYPNDFKLIECIDNGELMPALEIHNKIKNIIDKEL